MRRVPIFCLTLGMAVLGGCVVGPNYKRPAVNTPPTFRGQAVPEATSIADLPWWSVFQDPTLQDLIKTAIANNRDLRAAAARVEQARQMAAQSHAQYLPQIGYSAGISEGKNEELGAAAFTGMVQGTFLGALQASWEADVWGRVRRLNEYALSVYLATEQGRRGVLLSLVSSVAQAYFELLELDLRLEIARRNVDSFQGSLDIFQKRLEGGTASRLETSRAQAALSMVAANIPDLERQIAIQENELRVLLGSTPRVDSAQRNAAGTDAASRGARRSALEAAGAAAGSAGGGVERPRRERADRGGGSEFLSTDWAHHLVGARQFSTGHDRLRQGKRLEHGGDSGRTDLPRWRADSR